MPRWARRRHAARVMSRPMSAIEPLSGAISPVIRLKSVVLPAPLGPMISRRSPDRDVEIDVGGDAQAAERLAERVTASAVMGLRSGWRDGVRPLASQRRAQCVTVRARGLTPTSQRCHPVRHSRTEPGTSPSGMKLMMRMKMTPSTRFQRSM